jgi:hypothetical protein
MVPTMANQSLAPTECGPILRNPLPQASDAAPAPTVEGSKSSKDIPIRVNSCSRWCVRKDTQAFLRAVRRAVTRALPQAVMTARPGLARICRREAMEGRALVGQTHDRCACMHAHLPCSTHLTSGKKSSLCPSRFTNVWRRSIS